MRFLSQYSLYVEKMLKFYFKQKTENCGNLMFFLVNLTDYVSASPATARQ